MAIQKYFRVYSCGFVHLLNSEVVLGKWLLSEGLSRGHITLSYETLFKSGIVETRSAYSKSSLRNIYDWRSYRRQPTKPTRLRFEDSELRVEAPDGKVLGPDILIEFICAAENRQRNETLQRWSRYSPGSKCNWHRGTTFRIVHTQNERRQNDAYKGEEDVPKVRAARRNLPTYWDEVMRNKEDNWKSYRKSQHKKDYPSARLVSRFVASDLNYEVTDV
jgi:hypothetical protein